MKYLLALILGATFLFTACTAPLQQTECVLSDDCFGRPHDPCQGSWACKTNTCVWYCKAQPTTTTTMPIVTTTQMQVTTTSVATTTTLPPLPLDPEIRTLIQNTMTSHSALVLPLMQKATVGDEVIFGVGIQNKFREDYTFTVELSFDEARDLNFNDKITFPNQRVDLWAIQRQTKVDLAPDETVIVPVGIRVGPLMGTNRVTEPATYKFDVIVYHTKGTVTREYVASELTVMVTG